jgi:dephospho-CoA kinase
MKTPIRRLGITGGIGSGKSTVAKILQAEGIPVIDADQVARDLRQPGALGYEQILARFGTVDRQELRNLITQAPAARHDLEAILHPLIQAESNRRLNEAATQHPEAPFVIYEATLLIEAGRAADFDALLVVTAPTEARIQRILARDPMSRAQAENIVATQNPDSYRLEHADFVIENDAGFDDLKLKVRKALEQIRQA